MPRCYYRPALFTRRLIKLILPCWNLRIFVSHTGVRRHTQHTAHMRVTLVITDIPLSWHAQVIKCGSRAPTRPRLMTGDRCFISL
jgi:hypothetical protein